MPNGSAELGSVNSVIDPWVVMRPILPVFNSENHKAPPRPRGDILYARCRRGDQEFGDRAQGGDAPDPVAR